MDEDIIPIMVKPSPTKTPKGAAVSSSASNLKSTSSPKTTSSPGSQNGFGCVPQRKAAASAEKSLGSAKKAKKASKKDKKRKHEKKDKKSKKKAKTDDEAPLLNYRREELPEPAQAPLVPQGRQGEVTAPSWRGSREPGAPASWSRRDGASKKRSDAPRRTWDEVERDRNKSYGGMGRRR